MTTLILRNAEGICWRGQLTGNALTIGRGDQNDVVLLGDRVSRNHAAVEVREDRLTVMDRGSANGTFVNGRVINRPTVVRPRDTIRIGKHILSIEIVSSDDAVPNTERGVVVDEDATQEWVMETSARPTLMDAEEARARQQGPHDDHRGSVDADAFNDDVFNPPTPRVMQAVDPTEAQFLAALQASPNDDECRLVYADWLEQSGQNIKAEFLRLQCELTTLSGRDKNIQRINDRLRAISPASDGWWRALTSRPAIEKCEVKFKYKCPKRWTELTPTDEPAVRHCGVCDRLVHFCASLVEVVALGAKRECVAFDASLLASEANAAYDAAANEDSFEMGEIAR